MWLCQAFILIIIFICCVEDKRQYVITTGAQKGPNKTPELKKETMAKQHLDIGVTKDYANEDDEDEDYEDDTEEEIYDETPSKKKKRKTNMYKSGVMLGKRLTEAEIIQYLRKEEPVTFQIRNKKEMEKCSPFYYCSHKFLDKVCQPDPMFDVPCRITLHANGGDRGDQGPGRVIGTCKIEYFGCDTDTIRSESEIADVKGNQSKGSKNVLDTSTESEKIKENIKIDKDDEKFLSKTAIYENATENTKAKINSSKFDENILDKKDKSESAVKSGHGSENDYKINYENDYQTILFGD